MTLVAPRFVASLRRRLRSSLGKRFGRFVLVAAASVAASQIALVIFLGPARLTGGISGAAAGIVGAIVSYVLSRWAWERKGRPNVLRETLPFWLVAVGAWLVLGLSTKLGIHVAASMHLHGIKRQAVPRDVRALPLRHLGGPRIVPSGPGRSPRGGGPVPGGSRSGHGRAGNGRGASQWLGRRGQAPGRNP